MVRTKAKTRMMATCPLTEEQTAAVKRIVVTKKTDPYGRLGLEHMSFKALLM